MFNEACLHYGLANEPKAKGKYMCVSCFIMKKNMVARSDLTFYFQK